MLALIPKAQLPKEFKILRRIKYPNIQETLQGQDFSDELLKGVSYVVINFSLLLIAMD